MLTLIVTVLLAIFRPSARRPPATDGTQAVNEFQHDVLRFVSLKDVGLARLENEDLSGSDAAFAEVARSIPDDPLGPRNLVITRQLAAEKTDANRDPRTRATALERLREALLLLERNEASAATTHLLRAKAAQLRGDETGAVRALKAASQAEPNNPAVWYELSLAERDANAANVRHDAAADLKRAVQLEPENLQLLIESLGVESRSKDPDVAKSLARARTLLKPLAAVVQQFARVDLLGLVAEGQAAAQKADWQSVARAVALIGNVCRADPMVQSDQRRVKRNLMEYTLDDFGPDFYQKYGLPSDEDLPALDVTFRSAGPPGILRALRDVRDVALADFDLDGRLDLCVLTASSLELFNREPATSEWKRASTSPLRAKVDRILAVDLDNDFAPNQKPPAPGARGSVPASGAKSSVETRKGCSGGYVDVLAYGPGGVLVFHNTANAIDPARRLEPAEETADLAALKNVTGVAAVDLDGDGDLDLAIATTSDVKLFSNRGGLSFEDISGRSDLSGAPSGATEVLPLDWDRDVDADLAMADRSGQIGVLENVRHGRFRWRKLERFAQPVAASTCLAAIDSEGKASWDLLAGGPNGVMRIRTRTPQHGRVQLVSADRISNRPATRLLSWDYDNDGRLDLLLLHAGDARILRGAARGRFVPLPDAIGTPAVTAADTGDLDEDGDVDLVVVSAGQVLFLFNEGGNRRGWIDVNLHAMQVADQSLSPSGRVNSSGIGSLLELKTPGWYQAQIVRKQTSHFGLGAAKEADVLRVLWTNGIPSNVIHPPIDTVVCERQALKGSCPYLYTWNGKRFDFVTDLLWAAPLGMQSAEGVIAPDRSWEYLKLPGPSLAAREGEYQLKITEELWEATYLDSVELIAVDHPAGIEIFSNEKVGPAELAPFKIHTVSRRRHPLSAHNHVGRDLLRELSEIDGVFARPFERKLRQGLVDEHFIELDLGKLGRATSVVLFLTGWVLPTDTSINVALTHDLLLAPPRSPSLWTPDGLNGWRECMPFMGFPGGKTKTIAVDVTKLLRPDDGRLRIVGSREIYWDSIFFTVDEPTQPLITTPLPLRGADLHFRGFSEPRPLSADAPETYDYDRCSRQAKWPPMAGHFTRYGDVGELLKATDDRLVAFGAGDEIALRFESPPPPPAGWTRDFILHNVGWDKDADLNTVDGETVEPLPMKSMARYPYSEEPLGARSEAYRHYLRDFQTREQNRSAFWKQMRAVASP